MAGKIKIRLRATVELNEKQKVRLKFENAPYYQHQVNQFKYDKHVIVTIENERTHRTLRQNSYWHGVCFPIIAQLTGHTEAEAKRICASMFIKPKIEVVAGREIETRKGTSELTKGEGVEFTMDIRQLAVDLHGYIPTPEEAGYIS